MGIRVRAAKPYFMHNQLFRPGEVFELPDGVQPSSGMVVVERGWSPPPAAPAPADSEPRTLRALGDQLHAGGRGQSWSKG